MKTLISKYEGWTKYHIIHTLRNQWKFYCEGMKRGIVTRKDRNEVRDGKLLETPIPYKGQLGFFEVKLAQ